ncbi:MAG: heme ABC transporter permease [Gammaproteobacteria bacterium]
MSFFSRFHKFASPALFFDIAERIVPWLWWLFGITAVGGLIGGLVFAPADYQQGESFRIIYVHVPSAWMSLFIYMCMAGAGVGSLIWKTKVSDAFARAAAPLGASFTFLALLTGSLWGKPMWGTYWVWDARLTSELILLFLYLGYMALQSAIEDPRGAARAGAVLAIVGTVNIPIIHYSVEWWNTLHQGPTVSKMDAPSIHWSMLVPLLTMAISFMAYFGALVLRRTQSELLAMEPRNKWARERVS